jgi:undecaprenyl diphosphate synthase
MVPYHLGIIMDGNRRWAREKGLPVLEGHRRGFEKFKEAAKWCKKKGVRILTVFAFSTENWNRSKQEVSYLMQLLKLALSKKEIESLNKEGARLQIIGQRERFPKEIQKLIAEAEEKTKKNKDVILNLTLSYGGRAEILEAVKNIVRKKVSPDKIDEKLFSQNLWIKGVPDPDLIIRTSGEQRLSGFLIWQAAYSELYFHEKYWPEFSEKDLDQVFAEFSRRQRRFGK